MPLRVNGIGTGYIGGSNRQVFDGQCEHCHRQVKLQNYETRLWFTIFFVPVIPLVRRQILSYCPSCTWHRAVPFADWQRITQEAVGESAAKWDDNRDDPDAAIGMHSTLAAFNKRAQADRLAELLLQQFDHVSRVHLYLGGWYERTGKSAEADACFLKALELDPASLPARRAVAIGRIEQGRLAEARTLLADFEPPGPAFEPGLFFLLAKAWQKQDQHKEALDLFQMLLRSRPGIGGEKEFRKSVRRSEKALGTETSIVPADRFYRSKPFRWAAAAAAVIAGIVVWNFYIQTHRRLHVVNGLKMPITVQVDGGHPIEVGAKAQSEIVVAEGSHRAAVNQPGLAQPVEFSLESGWLDRFFKTPVYVLDPSRSAAVIWESAVYRPVNEAGGGGGSHQVHLGQTFTTYPDVDYQFEEFPREVKLDHGRETTKTRVSLADVAPLTMLVAALSESGPSPVLLDFCESHLKTDPTEKLLLNAYFSIGVRSGQAERCSAFFATRLDNRPLLTDWHRFYQEASEAQGRHAELVKQYDRYLAADSGNSALLYLRGRIDPDEATALVFFERAKSADPQNPYPWNALGYHQLAAGDFSAARASLENAIRLVPDDPTTKHNLINTRFALAEFAPLADEFEAELSMSPSKIESQRLLLEALVAGGDRQKAEQAHDGYAQKCRAQPGIGGQLELRSRACLLSLEGKFDELLAAASQIQDADLAAETRFEAQLELDQLEQASAALRPGNGQAGLSQLLLSLAWSRKGDHAQSAAARQRAITAFQTGRREERHIAELFAQAPALPAGASERLVIEPFTKAVVLIALAGLCPEQKASLLSLADKLNFRRHFPHHFLKNMIADLRGDL